MICGGPGTAFVTSMPSGKADAKNGGGAIGLPGMSTCPPKLKDNWHETVARQGSGGSNDVEKTSPTPRWPIKIFGGNGILAVRIKRRETGKLRAAWKDIRRRRYGRWKVRNRQIDGDRDRLRRVRKGGHTRQQAYSNARNLFYAQHLRPQTQRPRHPLILAIIGGRCIGPTGSIDLTERPAPKQKDRLAAVSPKSDQMF